MFWTGALFVFTPIVIGLGIGGYIWWKRTHGRRAGDGDPPPPVPGP